MAKKVVSLYALIEQFADVETVEAVKKKCTWEQMTILRCSRAGTPTCT